MLTIAGGAYLVQGPPPTPGTTVTPRSPSAVIFRVGPDVEVVTAPFAEGGSVAAVLTPDGWGVAAGQGRIFELTGVDTKGGALPSVIVP